MSRKRAIFQWVLGFNYRTRRSMEWKFKKSGGVSLLTLIAS